ncbi:MAG: YggS family pyridoxal phosphate-dependent enzyme [Anaerolineales bacterium]|jgi:pyridoxal phosphate enzyme (YggS family)
MGPELTAAEIRERAEAVRARITRAAQRAGRNPSEVTLVTVTKGHPVEVICRALEAGLTRFGENYLEEARPKMQAVTGPQIEWHMIGHIQSRKAREVAHEFTWIHSVDSLRLARRLDRFALERGARLPILLECNVSGEIRKYGFAMAQAADWEGALAEIRETAQLEHLRLLGLMTMAPWSEDPQAARPFFRRLGELRDWLRGKLPGSGLSELSMGMSDDFEIAVEEGATIVRIGRAILGPRSAEGTAKAV